MRRFQRRLPSRYRQLSNALAVLGLVSSSVGSAVELQVGRYATVPASPTQAQIQLLSAIVNVAFPVSVVTIGQAVHYLLQPSGYRLSPQGTSEPIRETLLDLPLPEPHRALGPMPLKTALETLAGPAFRLVEDPLHRLVSFERCEARGHESSDRSEVEAR
jgi:type IV pili sensor histidine kinase/response regulator